MDHELKFHEHTLIVKAKANRKLVQLRNPLVISNLICYNTI